MYQELARIIERDFREPIQGQQITASLAHMAAVAKDNRGTGDAAVAYKNDDLHVLDPFLLFYLRHGTWSVDKDLEVDPVQDRPHTAPEAAWRASIPHLTPPPVTALVLRETKPTRAGPPRGGLSFQRPTMVVR